MQTLYDTVSLSVAQPMARTHNEWLKTRHLCCSELCVALQSFGVGTAAVGMTVSFYALARLMTNLPAGILADRHGRQLLLVWGPAVTALGNMSHAISCAIVCLHRQSMCECTRTHTVEALLHQHVAPRNAGKMHICIYMCQVLPSTPLLCRYVWVWEG